MPAYRDINIHKQMEKEILMGKIWLRLHKIEEMRNVLLDLTHTDTFMHAGQCST